MTFLLEYLYLFILEAFAVNFVPFATCYILIVSVSINLGWKYSYNCLEVTISFPRVSHVLPQNYLLKQNHSRQLPVFNVQQNNDTCHSFGHQSIVDHKRYGNLCKHHFSTWLTLFLPCVQLIELKKKKLRKNKIKYLTQQQCLYCILLHKLKPPLLLT